MTGTAAARAFRIGVTGPIGCGKTTVASWLDELGADVIDADQVAREVTPPGSPALAAVVGAFGSGIVREDGSLNRAALGRIVFADPDALRRLEAIVHPAVRSRILRRIAGADRRGAPAIVIEAIKLVEGGLAELCDEVWLVVCDPGVQRRRLAARGADPADAKARIAAQAGAIDRTKPAATRVIDTSGTLEDARRAARGAYESARSRFELRGQADGPDATIAPKPS